MINCGNSPSSSYWNIDDILSEEELVQVKFNSDSKMNGMLDVNKQFTESDDADIPKGTILTLPYWLGIEL